ncbi:hypothetical protein NPIL_572741, partial [Nephila pilipes]
NGSLPNASTGFQEGFYEPYTGLERFLRLKRGEMNVEDLARSGSPERLEENIKKSAKKATRTVVSLSMKFLNRQE